MKKKHWAIFIDNNSNKTTFIKALLNGKPIQGLRNFETLSAALFSKLALVQMIDEEERHGTKIIARHSDQSLRSMSSGEQKKALLDYLLSRTPDYIILDNPFDNLDTSSQEALSEKLAQRSSRTIMIQIISRQSDLLPFITNYAFLDRSILKIHANLKFLTTPSSTETFTGHIPPPIDPISYEEDVLISLKDVSVSYAAKSVLKGISWTIKKGEFWQLIGKNGSGKTTILSIITGDNPKGYGQDLYLFGKKKGSGESIWDIKKLIGYFTPAMTDKFSGHHTVEHMLVSGLNDSIGLYIKPTEAQLRLAKEWLVLIDMWPKKDLLFCDLSMGQKRLIMTARAMIKHPLLLILDEPTAGLDDASALLIVALVNKIARESNTATLFVSHRKEPGLKPDLVYELMMTDEGSEGIVK